MSPERTPDPLPDVGRSLRRRRFRLVFLYALCLLPWVIHGAAKSLQTNANSPVDWVDDRFEARHTYDRFSERFGAGDTVIVSWPGCFVSQSALDSLTDALRRAPGFQDSKGALFDQVLSGRELIATLTRPPLRLTESEAKQRLGAALIGPDGQTTCVVIRFHGRALADRTRLVPLIRRAITHYCGVSNDALHLAGPVIDGYEVDRASKSTTERFAPISSLIVFIVCIVCLKSIYAALIVFGTASLCQALALAVVHYSGGEMTALLIVLPPLIQVLAIAAGIHLTNYYFDAIDSRPENVGRDEWAIGQAVSMGWLPCVLSSATTAIGLGSLAISGLAAVRSFGAYAAIGVGLTAATLLVLLPGCWFWKPVTHRQEDRGATANSLWNGLIAAQQRFSVCIALLGIALMVALGWGVWRLKASVRIETLFGPDSRLVHDYHWIESNVGPLVPIEVLVTVSEKPASAGDRDETIRTIRLLQAVADRLAEDEATLGVTSCVAFMPATERWIASPMLVDQFEQLQDFVAEANYLSRENGLQRWRFTAHLSAFGHEHYGDVLASIRSRLQPVVDEHPLAQEVSLEYSGLMPLVHEIQEQLLCDLYNSFLVAFALIAVVMTIVQGGLLPGLLSMLPNLFPSMVLFGVLGWIGQPIDIGSIMTASVAMGIAVDDTLHFLTFYGRWTASGVTRGESVLAAYRHCGRAMIQTTLICGAGLAAFGFSDFVPTARFAWMMVTLLLAALVGDLLLLPAVLLSPLGRLFPSGEQTVSAD